MHLNIIFHVLSIDQFSDLCAPVVRCCTEDVSVDQLPIINSTY